MKLLKKRLLYPIITLSIISFFMYANAYGSLIDSLEEVEYMVGLNALDWIKMAIGIITIVGGVGLFITTSDKRSHWPAYLRRTFFGIFIFCNVSFQMLFHVINVPNRRSVVCFLGSCLNKHLKTQLHTQGVL